MNTGKSLYSGFFSVLTNEGLNLLSNMNCCRPVGAGSLGHMYNELKNDIDILIVCHMS